MGKLGLGRQAGSGVCAVLALEEFKLLTFSGRKGCCYLIGSGSYSFVFEYFYHEIDCSVINHVNAVRCSR